MAKAGDKYNTLAQRVQADIIDYICSRNLQAGDRLPTEPELCELFQVSRTVLREGMKYLELLGIVSIEPGRGTFLRAFDVGNLLSRLPMRLLFRNDDFIEVIRVRQVLEEFCVEQAILRGNKEELAKLKACVDAMRERAARGEPMIEEDIAFHRQLAHMADTRLSLVVLEVFWQLRARMPMDHNPESLQLRYERHRRIYDAVANRDLQLARLYLAEHFAGSYIEFLSLAGKRAPDYPEGAPNLEEGDLRRLPK